MFQCARLASEFILLHLGHIVHARRTPIHFGGQGGLDDYDKVVAPTALGATAQILTYLTRASNDDGKTYTNMYKEERER